MDTSKERSKKISELDELIHWQQKRYEAAEREYKRRLDIVEREQQQKLFLIRDALVKERNDFLERRAWQRAAEQEPVEGVQALADKVFPQPEDDNSNHKAILDDGTYFDGGISYHPNLDDAKHDREEYERLCKMAFNDADEKARHNREEYERFKANLYARVRYEPYLDIDEKPKRKRKHTWWQWLLNAILDVIDWIMGNY